MRHSEEESRSAIYHGAWPRANTAAMLRGLGQELLADGRPEMAEAVFAAAAAYEVHGRPSIPQLVESRGRAGVSRVGAVHDPMVEDPEVSGHFRWDGSGWVGDSMLRRIFS